MFDKLIVSDAAGADFKPRRNYFLVSSVVVGLLFLTAVIFSIFASDYGLGTNGFELAELLSPIDMAAVETEPPKPRMPQTLSRSTSQLPTRQVNMPNLNETPIVPTNVSVVPNTQQARPDTGRFEISTLDSNPAVSNGSGRNNDGTGTDGPGLVNTPQTADNTSMLELPPVKAPPLVKKDIVRSIGVANGKATYLPKPPYPPAAIAVNTQGTVDVQVLIDESGRVVSAKAVSGPMLLRLAAEQAARNARFTPTLLSNVPVKVTGVIVYNFMRT